MIIGGLVLAHLYDVTQCLRTSRTCVCGFRSFEYNIVEKRRDLNMLVDYLVIEEPQTVLSYLF